MNKLLEEKFEEFKLLTGCKDEYLKELEKEVYNSKLPITLIQLLDKKIWDYKNIYNETLDHKCNKIRKSLSRKSILEILIEVFRIDKFANLLKRKLRNY
jgi:hypothetical protein